MTVEVVVARTTNKIAVFDVALFLYFILSKRINRYMKSLSGLENIRNCSYIFVRQLELCTYIIFQVPVRNYKIEVWVARLKEAKASLV